MKTTLTKKQRNAVARSRKCDMLKWLRFTLLHQRPGRPPRRGHQRIPILTLQPLAGPFPRHRMEAP